MRRVDVPFQGSQPPGPRFSAPNPQVRPVRQVLWLLGVEPQEVAPSGVLLSALPQVAPQIRALLCRAQQYRGEWVLPAGPQVVWPPEVLPLVGSLRQVLPRQALVVPSIRESPPPVPQPLGLLASPPQVGQQQEKCQAVESSPQRS